MAFHAVCLFFFLFFSCVSFIHNVSPNSFPLLGIRSGKWEDKYAKLQLIVNLKTRRKKRKKKC